VRDLNVEEIRDLRSAIRFAEEMGELVRIKKEVDMQYELAGVVAAFESSYAPALLFEKIKGYPGVSVCANLMAERSRALKLCGLPEEPLKFKEKLLKIIEAPIEPRIVKDGPCKENIVKEKIDVLKLLPGILAEVHQKNYYFQPIVVSKDPDTGVRNVGMYRTMVAGSNKLTVNIRRESHIGSHYYRVKERNQPFPVAIVVGLDPATYLGAITKVPYGYDEYGLAGAFRGSPIDLVKCETVDLEVPATSEIVIEGEILPPYEEVSEGPWPEYARYLSNPIKRPYMTVKAVTFRNNPINYVIIAGLKDNYPWRLANDAMLYKVLKDHAADFVVDVYLTPGSLHWHHAIVKVRKTDKLQEGLQKNVGLAAFQWAPYLDMVVLVDEDVNIYDLNEVDWAICTRCNPKEQMFILPEARTHANIPIAGIREEVVKSKLIIDATVPWKYKVKEKIPGVPYFTKSQWKKVNLKDYLEKKDLEKWIKQF